jgi:hypothetical protein
VHPPAAAASTGRAASEPGPVGDGIGSGGERLTRQEAFTLVGRAVAALTSGDRAVPASRVRQQAFELLGRDSESLSERNFIRILKDAHDGDVIDLRRRGDDYEVAVAVQAAPVAEQLNRAAAATTPAPKAAAASPAPRGMGPRGVGGRGRGTTARASEPPPDLLLLGVVEETLPAATPTTITASLAPASHRDDENTQAPVQIIEAGPPKSGRGRKKTPAKKATSKSSRPTARAADASESGGAGASSPASKPRRPRAKKTAASAAEG